MGLENKNTSIAGCQDETTDKKKIVQLGKVMVVLGAGTLTGICIALVKSGAIFRVF